MQYTAIREIGRGAFGIVEEVEDEHGARWAKKTFAAPTLPGIEPAELRSRFEREVRYQSQITHQNVVPIVEYELEVDPPWFIMPLAQCSLADELAVDRTLGGDPRKPLFDILAGIEAIHEKGYRHRDLKPANVLKLIDQGDNAYYAISDFGLMAPGVGQTSTLTTSDRGGGTPMYRAPECVNNFKRANEQSDIYSVGAILHDIFGGGSTRLPHVELSVAGELDAIIRKCTKLNARRRYETVADLRNELYQALTDTQLRFVSRAEEEIVSLLQQKDVLTDEEWDQVFQQIDENSEAGGDNGNIFKALSLAHLSNLATQDPQLFSSLGIDYARYAQNNSFGFDYCDVIASKAQIFYDLGKLDLKAAITIAMLELGASHNRWFVEHKFIKMAGKDISDDLANRIKAEIEVQHYDFEHRVRHVEGSIAASRNDLHSILRAMLPAI